ncbi:MAG: DegV family protein, partial [Oscillospiraceae bacterium]
MSDYVIVTDSSADLTADLVKDLEVEVLPLTFTIQGKTYQNHPDNRGMDP